MKEKLKQNSQVAKIFSNTFRYIDDLLTPNNPTFEQEISNNQPFNIIISLCPGQRGVFKPPQYPLPLPTPLQNPWYVVE